MNKFRSLGRRDPPHPETLRIHAGELQQPLQDRQSLLCHDITRLVMAFAEASASDKDAVRSHLQSLQDIMR